MASATAAAAPISTSPTGSGVYPGSSNSEPDLILTDDAGQIQTSGGSNASVAYMGMLATLIAWHKEDPVDDLERQHTEAVASFQGNRNPFVDHPEWVSCVFEGECGGGNYYTVAPCRLVDTRGPNDMYGGPFLSSDSLFRSDENPPTTSTVNFGAGAARANNAILALSETGELTVRPFVANSGQVHLVMDVVGYFD